MITLTAQILLSDGISIDIDQQNLISIERTISDRNDIELPSYGIISNTGNLEFSDIDGVVYQYITAQMLKEGQEVLITLNNTVLKKSEQLCIFEIAEIDYDINNRVASVSLKDNLEQWQEIQVPKRKASYSISMYEMYEYLKSKTPTKWKFRTLDAYTVEYLNANRIAYPYMESDTLWKEWNKLCQITASHIYLDSNNEVAFVHDF